MGCKPVPTAAHFGACGKSTVRKKSGRAYMTYYSSDTIDM